MGPSSAMIATPRWLAGDTATAFWLRYYRHGARTSASPFTKDLSSAHVKHQNSTRRGQLLLFAAGARLTSREASLAALNQDRQQRRRPPPVSYTHLTLPTSDLV